MSVKKPLLLITTIVLFGLFAEAKPTLIVAGDSWGVFPCNWNSFDSVFDEENLSVEVSCAATTAINVHARKWLNMGEHATLIKRLKAWKEVRAVYLSIGGNDLISAWKTSMTPQEEQDLFNKVLGYTKDILAAIHAVRPDVKILLAGYDYSRFMSESSKVWKYREFYENMGKPSAHELHTAILRYVKMEASLANNADVFFIHYNGLMHYYFGNSDVGLEPFKTTPPELISPTADPAAFGGNPDFELDSSAMMRITGLRDSYHLSPTGFYYLAKQAVSRYLKNWFSK